MSGSASRASTSSAANTWRASRPIRSRVAATRRRWIRASPTGAAIFYIKPGYWILCDLLRGQDTDLHTLEQLFHLAPVEQPDAAEPLRPGEVSVSSAAVVTQEAGLGNLAILPVDTEGLAVRAQKGETSPAVGWYGVYGEFPAWDVTLERRTVLPARMDAVLFPLLPGETAHPTITRLRTDAQVTAFRIQGAGIDDTFILCEEGAGL